MISPLVPPELRRSLDASLTTGERVRWAAQPRASGMLGAFAIYFFAIPWTAFALFWESMALMPILAATDETSAMMKFGFGIVFPLFGVPFVLIGFAMLYAPFGAMRAARRTVHAVTDRRLITIIAGRATKTKSAMIDRIGPIERKAGRDGWGWLKIQTHSKLDSDGDRITEKFEWTGIPDVAAVERLILDAQPRP
jgi:hypothetical protein